jgi:hypothetical protein
VGSKAAAKRLKHRRVHAADGSSGYQNTTAIFALRSRSYSRNLFYTNASARRLGDPLLCLHVIPTLIYGLPSNI